ncbi:hypothetical protein [Phenylobacterium sp.]|uniref:hypothetical protein n=1 Tax=Phenylobacterium sp. TaxID=1871053 RepID=UPI00261A3517|nr:hypothetical protein [Phenylobacterium sp.]
MNKTLAAAMAAVTFGGAVATAALPTAAEARGFHGGGFHHGGFRGDFHRHGDFAGAALLGGVAGLAIGAALADRPYYGGYYGGYYGPAYYDDDYYGGYAVCESARWVWDPYIHRRVLVRHRYPC